MNAVRRICAAAALVLLSVLVLSSLNPVNAGFSSVTRNPTNSFSTGSYGTVQNEESIPLPASRPAGTAGATAPPAAPSTASAPAPSAASTPSESIATEAAPDGAAPAAPEAVSAGGEVGTPAPDPAASTEPASVP